MGRRASRTFSIGQSCELLIWQKDVSSYLQERWWVCLAEGKGTSYATFVGVFLGSLLDLSLPPTPSPSLYVYMYICVYVCLYVHVYVCVHVCGSIYMCLQQLEASDPIEGEGIRLRASQPGSWELNLSCTYSE